MTAIIYTGIMCETYQGHFKLFQLVMLNDFTLCSGSYLSEEGKDDWSSCPCLEVLVFWKLYQGL